MCGYIACAILVPYQGLNPSPLQWKLRILTTGLPVKSFVSYYSPHWSLELTVLWAWLAFNAPTYLSPLSKVYKCSHLHRWISVSRAHNMGTYTHSHGYSCHLCLNMCWFMYENTQTDRRIFLLCFTDNAASFSFFLTNWTFTTTHFWTSTLAPFSVQYLLTSCLCQLLVILTIFQAILLLLNLFFWSVISVF